MTQAQSTPLRHLASLLFAVLCLGYLGIETVKFTADGRQRIQQAERVVVLPAVVSENRHRQWRGYARYGSSLNCEWTFKYTFVVDEVRYTGSNLTNLPNWEGCELALPLLRERPAGASIKIFHDPDSPYDSFAAENRSILRYYWLPVLGLTIILVLGAMAGGRTFNPWSLPRYGRWTQLQSDVSQRALTRIGIAAAAWWSASCMLSYAIYAKSAIVARSSPGDFVFAWVLGAALVLFAVVSVIRLATFEEPAVAVDPYPLRTGKPSEVRVAVRLRRDVEIRSVTIGLRCLIKAHKGQKELVKSDYIQQVNRPLSAGDSFDQIVEITPPTSSTEDTPLADELSSEMSWMLSVFVDGDGLKDHRSQYPVEVVITSTPRPASERL